MILFRVIICLIVLLTNCKQPENKVKYYNFKLMNNQYFNNFDYNNYVYFRIKVKDTLGNDLYDKNNYKYNSIDLSKHPLNLKIIKFTENKDIDMARKILYKNCNDLYLLQTDNLLRYFDREFLEDTLNVSNNQVTIRPNIYNLENIEENIFRIKKSLKIFDCICVYFDLWTLESQLVILPLNENKIHLVALYFKEASFIE